MGKVTPFLIATAAIELGAGLTLLLAPAVVTRLLFGSVVGDGSAAGMARLSGIALLSLGTGCWWARNDAGAAASKALVVAMSIYNVAVVVLVLVGGLGSLGLLQWAAVILHGVMGIWCAQLLVDRRG